MRLVQLTHPIVGRRVAVVKEPKLQLVKRYHSIYELALAAIERGISFGRNNDPTYF